MTLSNRKMLHNFNFNNRIIRKEKKVPVYQLFEESDSDYRNEIRLLGWFAVFVAAVLALSLWLILN